MMTLHQLFEPRLNLGTHGIDLKPQGIKRFALRIADGPALRFRLVRLCSGARRTAEFAKHAKRIVRGAVAFENSAALQARRSPATCAPDLPGRPMAGYGILLITGDRVFAHPGKKIVGLIVFAHVFETETPILARAALRRAVRGALRAARPITGRPFGAQPPVLIRLDANAIEKGRVEFHVGS